MSLSEHEFNPAEDSTGRKLYEHWETGANGSKYLLLVASTPYDMTLEPGDFILERTWAPASHPKVYNHAREEDCWNWT